MTKPTETLADLRREIDAIDEAIHDLIMRRTGVVERVRLAKEGQTVKIRPAREADILYRLMARHRGPFPKRELARIWREMIVATLSFEGPFSVAVYVGEDDTGYWDMARDQYGTFTPMTRHGSARATVEAVRTGEATVGILPFPWHDDSDNWWRLLLSTAPETPRIIARLPFLGETNARQAGHEALVICPVPPEETGRDRTFLAVESEEDIGFNAIEDALAQSGMSVAFHQTWHDPNRPPGWTYLVEIFGFVATDGRQISRLQDALGKRAQRILHLGSYGTPLGERDFAPAEEGSAENQE